MAGNAGEHAAGSATRHAVKTKRIYEAAEPDDGERVLVDRLWPRGISKERASLGLWAKDIAPTTELRTWFGHDPARYEEFASRYRAELDQCAAAARFSQECRKWLESEDVTLLYAAKAGSPNHAEVLKNWLEQ